MRRSREIAGSRRDRLGIAVGRHRGAGGDRRGLHDRPSLGLTPNPDTDRDAGGESARRMELPVGMPPGPAPLLPSVLIVPLNGHLAVDMPPGMGSEGRVLIEVSMPLHLAVGVPQQRNPLPIVASLRSVDGSIARPPVVTSLGDQRMLNTVIAERRLPSG